MNPNPPTKISRRIVTLCTLIGLTATAALVLCWPPTQYSFYPRCPIYEYLHLQCPGCGSTRAFAALLHGHLAEALHFNALFVCAMPLLTSYAVLSGYRAWSADTFRWPAWRPAATYALLAAAAIFTISRNLSV